MSYAALCAGFLMCPQQVLLATVQLRERLNGEADILLVDVRPQEQFELAHLPGLADSAVMDEQISEHDACCWVSRGLDHSGSVGVLLLVRLRKSS
jgi:hypothetical protein